MEKENGIEETLVMQPPKKSTKKTKKPKRRWNISGILGVVILLIIVVIAFNIARTFTDRVGTPVVGKRFKNALVEKITDKDLNNFKQSIQLPGVQQIEVNLKSATLRVNVDVDDQFNEEQVQDTLTKINDLLIKKFPLDTYFKNRGDVKMYDYEIHVFTTIKSDDKIKRVYIMKGKTAAGEPYTEIISKPKNEKVTKEVTEVFEEKKK